MRKLSIQGNTSQELYDGLERYVSDAIEAGEKSGKTADEVIEDIVAQLSITGDLGGRDFSFLNTDQFQREFRSIIYIPNERRELRVQKVDQNGKGVNGVTFTLTAKDGSTVTGTTANVNGQDGMLIFRPDAGEEDGYAQMTWAEVGSEYTLEETSAPAGYTLNKTKIPVVVGIYSIYADAGSKNDGVTVMAGVGKLMQTMTKYAADDMVNITLRDITAIAQTQKANSFKMDGWKDDLLEGTNIPRSMNLHYGMNAVVDYGLHDEDGGQNIYPFFTTDEGFLRTRVVQNTAALQGNGSYHGNNSANWDNLEGRDITSLFSLLNTVVVTDTKDEPDNPTGKLRIGKIVSGDGVADADYAKNFTFSVSLKNADGSALEGSYYYYGEQRAGYITDGGTLSLRHNEALTVLGLPVGTKWEVSEVREDGWNVKPSSGTVSGGIEADATANALFTNYKGKLKLGDLSVSKTVKGNASDKNKDFNFTVTLSDRSIAGTYGDMEFKDGVASFTLSDGESKTATGLPSGISYKVEEDDYSKEGYTTSKTGDTGEIPEGDTVHASFTNTRDVTPPDTGSLTVSKTVAGNAGETDKSFRFTVTLGDTSIDGTFGDMTFTDGVADFTLKHGESKTATGLPAGTSYKVEEDDYSKEGYTTSKTGDTGEIPEGDTVRASFINTKGVDDGGSTDTPGEDRDGKGEGGRLPQTGDMLPLVPLVLMMVLAACAAAIAAVRLRKN